MSRQTRAFALMALGVVMASAAHAVPMEFTGYFRSGAGSSSEGGKEVCFRLPGSIVWFRLGNECDTYASLNFGATMGEVDGTKFKGTFTMAYGTQQLANWEQSTPSWRQAFVEAQDIGAGLGVPALKGATLWAGKRFYKNPDIHILDYTYWEPAQGPGFGLDNVDAGAAGKFSYALFRIGDFSGYGIDGNLGGFNPNLIDGGSRTASVHDFRLQDIPVNEGGKLTVGLDVILKNNRDGLSTYTVETTKLVDLDGDGVLDNVVVRDTRTIDNDNSRNGLGLTLSHQQDNFLGLGGFHNVTFQYAKDAASLKGFGFAGAANKRDEWLLFNHWVMEPKGTPVTAVVTAGYRSAKETFGGSNGVQETTSKVSDFWIGARPQYHINNIWSLMSEVGYQQVKVEGQEARKLAKLTLGTQFSMGRSIWSRPAIRFFGTYAKWNAPAANAGSVACGGRDCNTPVSAFGDKSSGLSYGVQVEAWF